MSDYFETLRINLTLTVKLILTRKFNKHSWNTRIHKNQNDACIRNLTTVTYIYKWQFMKDFSHIINDILLSPNFNISLCQFF